MSTVRKIIPQYYATKGFEVVDSKSDYSSIGVSLDTDLDIIISQNENMIVAPVEMIILLVDRLSGLIEETKMLIESRMEEE